MTVYKYSTLKKLLVLLTVIILIVTFAFFEWMTDEIKIAKTKRWTPENSTKLFSKTINSTNFIKQKKEFLKVFHLDLKGAPPKLNYLLNVLPIIAKSGANAVLMEYEDMFPFYGSLRNISATNAYSLDELKFFIRLTKSLKMEVIPLVQTFGHLEYVLKLEEFQHLRELDYFPQEICPSKKEAVDLIKEMLRQIMLVHKDSKYIHIGCDEVRNLAVCPLCSRTHPQEVFARHVRKIANYIKIHYKGVTPLIWDDMLRVWHFKELKKSGLGSVVEPVVWVYINQISDLVPPFIFNSYAKVFSKLWVASAFKGAYGETEIVPNITRHFENNLSWMKLLMNKHEEFNIKPEVFSGIFVTGWSRYDHFAVLCELLPVAFPSLVLNLLFLDRRFVIDKLRGFAEWLRILQCPNNLNLNFTTLDREVYFQNSLGRCSFPGSNLYSAALEFQRLKRRMTQIANTIESSGWTSRYNFKRNFTSPWRIIGMFPKEGFGGELLKKEVDLFKSTFFPIMSQYFDNFTILEWEEQNIKPIEEKLMKIRKGFETLLKRKTWPRRPLG